MVLFTTLRTPIKFYGNDTSNNGLECKVIINLVNQNANIIEMVGLKFENMCLCSYFSNVGVYANDMVMIG